MSLGHGYYPALTLDETERTIFNSYVDQCSGFRYTDLANFEFDALLATAKWLFTELELVGVAHTPQQLFRLLFTVLAAVENRGLHNHVSFKDSGALFRSYASGVVGYTIALCYRGGWNTPFHRYVSHLTQDDTNKAYVAALANIVDSLIERFTQPVTVEASEYHLMQVERLLKL